MFMHLYSYAICVWPETVSYLIKFSSVQFDIISMWFDFEVSLQACGGSLRHEEFVMF